MGGEKRSLFSLFSCVPTISALLPHLQSPGLFCMLYIMISPGTLAILASFPRPHPLAVWKSEESLVSFLT